ncbi:MAG: hypothetical protein RSB77_04210 [Bacilli bacterium]
MIKIDNYTPKKVEYRGKITIFDKKYVIKKENNKIFDYLESRNFNYFPKIIENNRALITEYIDEIDYPEEQKLYDLIDLTSLLHSKTTYFKEVDEDKIKGIYEDIKSNIEYLYTYYEDKITLIEKKVYMSPSEYLIARNIDKIFYVLDIARKELEELLLVIPKKIRYVVVHNNLNLTHYIRNKQEYLTSWDKAKFDIPIFDLYKLFIKYPKYNYLDLLQRYEIKYPLLDYEKKILLILLGLPEILKENKDEFEKTRTIKKMIIKLENLPDYLKQTPKDEHPPKETQENVKSS